jgi:hypothetical protein
MGFLNKIKGLSEVPQFNVYKEPLFDSRGSQIPNLFSLQREDTNEHLGTCSESYRPIQMDEMIDTIKTACKRVNESIEHVGWTESRGGKRMLIQSKIGSIGFDDQDAVEGYFYTLIDNSGKCANKIIPSTTRISCDNAFHLINKENKESESYTPSLRHNWTFGERVEAFSQNISSNIVAARKFSHTARKLRTQKFTKDEMVKMVETLLPVEKDESTRRINKREKIALKFGEGGIANLGQTRWDAFNAITEYETHQKFTPEKFIRNLTGKTLSTKALEYLQEV